MFGTWHLRTCHAWLYLQHDKLKSTCNLNHLPLVLRVFILDMLETLTLISTCAHNLLKQYEYHTRREVFCKLQKNGPKLLSGETACSIECFFGLLRTVYTAQTPVKLRLRKQYERFEHITKGRTTDRFPTGFFDEFPLFVRYSAVRWMRSTKCYITERFHGFGNRPRIVSLVR